MYAQAEPLSAQLWCLINGSFMMLLLFQLAVEETREQRDTRGERRASLVLQTEEGKVNNTQHENTVETLSERWDSLSSIMLSRETSGREMRAWFYNEGGGVCGLQKTDKWQNMVT